MGSRTGLFVSALLLISGVLCEDDYFYDETVEEEQVSTHVPKFTSSSQMITAKEGDTVTLPCFVDKLENNLVMWKSKDLLFFVGTLKQQGGSRFSLSGADQTGNRLVISNVGKEDSGVYECQIASTPPVNLTHTLDVQYPPTVTTNPENGVLIARQRDPASLVCSADGNPKPTVTWTKKDGVLPYGEKKSEGETLEIGSVDVSHMGNYICTVDNGIGKPVVKSIRLEVNFPPQITVEEKMVHTGAGYEAQMTCKVMGQPLPQVKWARSDGKALDDDHHQQEQESDMFSIIIEEVRDSDLGVYSCKAENTLGTAQAIIELTGKPKPVKITSEPNGKETNSYTMDMTVESYAPVEEYKIIYKMAKEESKSQWEEVVISASTSDDADGVMYKFKTTIRDLQAASVYEAIVTAKNKYGWSSEPAKPFRFSTLGANERAAELTEGEALGSKDPNSSSTARLAITSALAALLSLLAIV